MQTEATHLTPGQIAPDFIATSISGARIDLAKYRGYKVWLALYRYAGCPLCNAHIHGVLQSGMLLKKNELFFIAVFDSQPSSFPKALQTYETDNLRLVPDPVNKIHSLYGTERKWSGVFHPTVFLKRLALGIKGFHEKNLDGSFNQIPAHFLINEDGTIHTAYYGHTIADHMPWPMLKPFMSHGASAHP